MPRIALNFQDGFTRIIHTWGGETVVNAAYRQRVNVPLDCSSGVCGACKCRVRSGEYAMGNKYVKDALSNAEAADGLALACQMVPKSNMILDIFATTEACKVQPETFSTTISRVELLSPDIAKVIANHDSYRRPEFLPGQYANIEIPGTHQTRSFSFSGPSGGDAVEFLVRLLPDGDASNYFRRHARAGEKLKFTAPFGSFYLRPLQAPALFFAGGTGIAPFLAMLDTLAASTDRVRQRISLFYGVTCDNDAVELTRLNALKARLPFHYRVCVSGEPSRKFAPGLVTQWITKDKLSAPCYDAYVCGPPAMVDAVRVSLARHRIRLTNFYTEKFTPSGVT